jgi:trehalose 6-phosphate synthase
MSTRARFLTILFIGLGVLTWIGERVLTTTARSWFESDLALRARLVVGSARESLIEHIRSGDEAALRGLLEDITHDERIMAATACRADGSTLARTSAYPEAYVCPVITRHLTRGRLPADRSEWTETASLPGGPVHISAVELRTSSSVVGVIGLVHDVSYISRREASARRFLLSAFAVLAITASGFTIVAARLAFIGWTSDLRRALHGDIDDPQYRPLLRDVYALARRLSAETESEHRRRWTPERLKRALGQQLQGEQIVILANREPYIHERGPDDRIRAQHPASGLVSALEPVMRVCSGVWVAHGSGSADRETADARGRVSVPPGQSAYTLRRVWLDDIEERGYYYGFANEGLWPLCHVAHTRPIFRADDWAHYRTVNQRFAEAVCDEVDGDDPIVLVQDYHFALAPRMIRERLPRATIIAFWHIPWPNTERFGICPWHGELLDGLLGASILGFHTQLHCNNFLDAADTYLETRVDRERNAVVCGTNRTLVRPYPISIEWPVRWLAELPAPAECRRSVRGELGLPDDVRLGIGVDRLDYTKGIEERFLAVERLLEKHPEWRGRFTFVQLAAPSRTKIERYRDLSESIEATVARINARFPSAIAPPIVLLRSHHEPLAVFRFYRAADVCYVSSLHDGMNLVAKEFVAAREDEQGVLVLSQFTGAARELGEAIIVNPYDLEHACDALAAALRMSSGEQRDRMRALRGIVADFNVYRWAGRMLADAAGLRRQERVRDRLTPLRIAKSNHA